MGRQAHISSETKSRIKAVYPIRRGIATHNRDGKESPLEVLYRAAGVVERGGKAPLNAARKLPGGKTVGEILTEAGILTL
jgi:hypothetical protein